MVFLSGKGDQKRLICTAAPDRRVVDLSLNAKRAFVLIPLAEISPHAIDPRSGLTAAELLANLPPTADPGAVVRITSPLWPAD